MRQKSRVGTGRVTPQPRRALFKVSQRLPGRNPPFTDRSKRDHDADQDGFFRIGGLHVGGGAGFGLRSRRRCVDGTFADLDAFADPDAFGVVNVPTFLSRQICLPLRQRSVFGVLADFHACGGRRASRTCRSDGGAPSRAGRFRRMHGRHEPQPLLRVLDGRLVSSGYHQLLGACGALPERGVPRPSPPRGRVRLLRPVHGRLDLGVRF
jgi:hypothetical protein